MPAQYRQHKASQLPHNSLTLLASRDPETGAAEISSDARLFAGQLDAGQTLTAQLNLGYGWLQLARGALTVNGVALRSGDGLAISDESELAIQAQAASEFLLFDLA